MTHNVTPQQEDWMEKRFESFAKTIHSVLKEQLKEQTETLVASVDKKIETKVNGSIIAFRKENQDMYASLKTSIDVVDMKINKLDEKTEPAVEVIKTTKTTGRFLIWASTIGGALVALYKLIKW